MKLSQASAFAVFALTLLAESKSEVRSQGRDLARELNVPPNTLLKALQQLARGGLLESMRGQGGGFRLARPPEEISILEVVELIDGKLGKKVGYLTQIRGMPRTRIGLELALEKSAQSAREFLGGTTIRDLMNHR